MSRHRHHHRTHGPPWRISRALRISTLWLSLLLWLSGCCWMLLHYFFQQPGEFGVMPNHLEPSVIRVHGIVAVASVFLFGWLTSRHVVEAWRQHHRRSSGIFLLVVVALLVLSGYSLYYLSDDLPRRSIAVMHEALGVMSAILALVHWLKPFSKRQTTAEVSTVHRG